MNKAWYKANKLKINQMCLLYVLVRHNAYSTQSKRLKFDVFPEKWLTRDVFSQKRAQRQLTRDSKGQWGKFQPNMIYIRIG